MLASVCPMFQVIDYWTSRVKYAVTEVQENIMEFTVVTVIIGGRLKKTLGYTFYQNRPK